VKAFRCGSPGSTILREVITMDLEDLRLHVYRSFARTGAPPHRQELAVHLGVDPVDVDRGLRVLADRRHVVLDAGGAVVMAHPFASIPMGFSVMGASTLWWGGCAWDSFALPHLMPDEHSVLVATTCPACGRPHAFVVDRTGPPPGDAVAHFLVPAVRIWDDVVHTCRHQRIFCSTDHVEQWLAAEGQQLGYVLDLPTLWRLAAGWYSGRLDRGYTRRDPTEAGDYLYGVGLRGSFWGLPDD
jgi:hypothetical protein